MQVFTDFGPAEIGHSTGICWFRDDKTCTDERYYVTNLQADGTYDDDFFWLKKDGAVRGVCENHARQLEREGWTNLGKGDYHPVSAEGLEERKRRRALERTD